jgi:mono/diheme cytochrome c family protein
MRKSYVLLAVPLLFCLSVLARPSHQQDQKTGAEAQPPAPEFKIPADAAKQVNPVKPTAESLAAGKKMYGYDCAMCHGATGDGKGDLAGDMKLKMMDFRDAESVKKWTDGELFYIIRNGKGDMPKEGEDRVKSEEVWNMINYIHSFAKKDASEAAKP